MLSWIASLAVLLSLADVTVSQLTSDEIETFRNNGVVITDFADDNNFWSFQHNGE